MPREVDITYFTKEETVADQVYNPSWFNSEYCSVLNYWAYLSLLPLHGPESTS